MLSPGARIAVVAPSGIFNPDRLRFGDKVDDVRLERRKMQFLYRSDDMYVFMDSETYDQMELTKDIVGDATRYLKENEIVDVLVAENNAINVELPIFVELAVTQTDPGLRGDTATGGSKPATLETGASVQVPLFVEQGDILKIDTRTDTYVERA